MSNDEFNDHIDGLKRLYTSESNAESTSTSESLLRLGRGSMFRNTKCEKRTDPNAKGDAFIECPHCQQRFEVWLKAWTEKLRTDEKYWALSIRAKGPQA